MSVRSEQRVWEIYHILYNVLSIILLQLSNIVFNIIIAKQLPIKDPPSLPFMQNKKGLIYCSGQFGSNPFCVSKLLELLLSGCLLIVIIYDLIVRFKKQRQCSNIFYVLFWLMILSLICTQGNMIGNIGFCLDHQLYHFNYMEGFFYSIYFTVIVYYVALKLSKVMQARNVMIYIIHGLFTLTILFLIGVLIQKFVQTYNRCQCSCARYLELWYLVVDGYSLVLSIVLTIVGITYTRKQKQKLQGIQNPVHYKNPLPNIWIWISANIFTQLCSFIQSLFFELTPQLDCHFSNNYVTDQYVKLLVAFLTFHLGMFSTIIFFRGRQQRELEGLNISKETGKDVEQFRRPTVQIQLMEHYEIIDNAGL